MLEFWYALVSWSYKTFGSKQNRGPKGPLKHLKKEIDEVLAKPDDIEEYADLVFLVFDATWRAGFDYHSLLNACHAKLEKNIQRKWPAPTPDGVVEHIKEESQ